MNNSIKEPFMFMNMDVSWKNPVNIIILSMACISFIFLIYVSILAIIKGPSKI
jgi:hypothetical protein